LDDLFPTRTKLNAVIAVEYIRNSGQQVFWEDWLGQEIE
jgi:hypothetical protein